MGPRDSLRLWRMWWRDVGDAPAFAARNAAAGRIACHTGDGRGAMTVIIGGGISGLAAAYYLAKGGASPTLIESRSRLGGVIQTEKIEGCTIEAGPDSFLSVK